jgi:hypothetical protein
LVVIIMSASLLLLLLLLLLAADDAHVTITCIWQPRCFPPSHNHEAAPAATTPCLGFKSLVLFHNNAHKAFNSPLYAV